MPKCCLKTLPPPALQWGFDRFSFESCGIFNKTTGALARFASKCWYKIQKQNRPWPDGSQINGGARGSSGTINTFTGKIFKMSGITKIDAVCCFKIKLNFRE